MFDDIKFNLHEDDGLIDMIVIEPNQIWPESLSSESGVHRHQGRYCQGTANEEPKSEQSAPEVNKDV